MRFFSVMQRHPFARGWFSVGGCYLFSRMITLSITPILARFVRDNENSWSIFFMFLRIHVNRVVVRDSGVIEICAKNLSHKDDPDWGIW